MGLLDDYRNFPEAVRAGVPSQAQLLGPQIRMLMLVLYDSSMNLADRARAYEGLSKIDPVSFPETSRVNLIYSLTKGKLAKSAVVLAETKQTQIIEQIQRDTKAEDKRSLEDVLYAPDENPAVREQAYQELSKIFPEEFPVKDSVSIKKSIFAGDIATTSKALHPDYISPQEQKKLDIQKVKEEKILAKEQKQELTSKLKEFTDQLTTLKGVQEKLDGVDSALQKSELDLAEKRIGLEEKVGRLNSNSPTYRQDNEYLSKHLTLLGQREQIFNHQRQQIAQRLPEIEAASGYIEAQKRYIKNEPEPDITDDYAVYTWNKDGTLASIKTEQRPSIDQQKAREAGEFPYVGRKKFSEQRIFDKETGSLTTLPIAEGDYGLGDPFIRD